MTQEAVETKTLADGRVVLHCGDCRDALKGMPDNSIDSVVTDPPYALVSIVKRFGKPGSAPAKGNDAYMRASKGFMGRQWDNGETAFATEFWAEVLRVLKPGGHVVAFSGTRTYHRMAVAIEDAGFEIRDQLGWLYGSGFPKSHDVSKGIDRMLGAERKKVKTLMGPTGNKYKKGLGDDRPWMQEAAANGFHEHDGDEPATPQAREWQGWGTALKPCYEPICLARKPLSEKSVAANVLKWGTGALNIDATRIGDSGGPATVTGDRRNTTVHALGDGLGAQGGSIEQLDKGRWPGNILTDGSPELLEACGPAADSVSRLYFSAKADKTDRMGSKHPTVKPVDLMQWLVRLVTPPGGTTLDPFAGSGSTGEAALREGMRAVLCERETEYQADIVERIRLAEAGPLERKARAVRQVESAGPLFGDNDNEPIGGGVFNNGTDRPAGVLWRRGDGR